jgi:energy-converting hydrogenase Eha subunit A
LKVQICGLGGGMVAIAIGILLIVFGVKIIKEERPQKTWVKVCVWIIPGAVLIAFGIYHWFYRWFSN